MKQSYDVIIVGAGIVGCACAYYLSKGGRQVLLLEKGTIGGDTTAAGMGHVVVMDDSEPQFALTKYSRDLWRDLYPSLPSSCEVQPCGTLWVAADEEEMAHLGPKEAFYRKRGVEAEILDEKQLAEAEPNLRSGLPGGLLIPADSVIYPMTAAKWLADEARRAGADVHLGIEVESACSGSVVCGGTPISCETVVNAAGNAGASLTPGLAIQPRKGHLVITDRYPGWVRHQLVELGYLKSAHSMEGDSVAFNVQPRLTGQLLIGSSRQFTGLAAGIDHDVLGKMVARAVEYMPKLAGLNAIRTWTGFRAATPDKLPLIGEWEPGLFIAAGHEGLGITTSLGTGAMIADLLAGRAPAIAAEPFSPRRALHA